jgi:uncharacterized protein
MKSLIKRRRFGKTGLYVSELSFGAMNLRKLDTSEEAYKILNYVLDQGINLIDTARAYNGENSSGEMIESEVLVGTAIRNRKDLDEPIVIVTKGHGYTLEELDNNLSTSRSKLGIEGNHNLRIGNNDVKLVYFFHGINKERWETMKNSGVLEKAKELKETGLINYIGFSSHYGDGKEIKEAVDTGIFDVVELPYNVFNRSLGEDGEIDLLEYIHKKEIGIINMKAFNGNGMPALYNMLKEYMTIDYDVMLNFCLSNNNTSSVDAGAMYVEQFEQDIKTALDDRLTEEEKTIYKQEADKIAPNLNNICRECMHCLEKFECTQGIHFPTVLSIHGRYEVAEKLGKDTSPMVEQYEKLALDAENCIECGLCVPWCEYKINIPEMMKKAHDELKNK